MEFEVIRSNRKSMAIEIKANKLIIRAPIQATNEDINSFMLNNKACRFVLLRGGDAFGHRIM